MIDPSACLSIIAIIVFISYLFGKIEEWDPGRHLHTAVRKDREMGHRLSSEIRSVPKAKKKKEMKNDTSISPLRERERERKKIPQRKRNRLMPACLFCFSMWNFYRWFSTPASSGFWNDPLFAISKYIIFRQWSCFHGMQIKHIPEWISLWMSTAKPLIKAGQSRIKGSIYVQLK